MMGSSFPFLLHYLLQKSIEIAKTMGAYGMDMSTTYRMHTFGPGGFSLYPLEGCEISQVKGQDPPR